jgi:hypothetical protein
LTEIKRALFEKISKYKIKGEEDDENDISWFNPGCNGRLCRIKPLRGVLPLQEL